jgi:hypothetical protein
MGLLTTNQLEIMVKEEAVDKSDALVWRFYSGPQTTKNVNQVSQSQIEIWIQTHCMWSSTKTFWNKTPWTAANDKRQTTDKRLSFIGNFNNVRFG